MRNKRPILALEVEPGTRGSLLSVPPLESLLSEAKEFPGLASKLQTGLHTQACDLASNGKQAKAARCMFEYLSQAASVVPALSAEWKKHASETLTVVESQAIAFLRTKKLPACAKMIRIIDKTLESGLHTAQKRWHLIRALHLHIYYDIATEKLSLALKNLQKAQNLERDSVPVLAMVTSRLLEAFVRSYQGDHKSAVIALREALNAQHQKESESLKQYQDPEWFFRILGVLLYNLAAESLALHLRSEATHYITKAVEAASHDACTGMIRMKVAKFKEELLPESEEGNPSSSRPEETKLPFLPGGQVAKSEAGKIVELTHESPVPVRRPNSHKLPKIKSMHRRESKENPYLQYVKEKGRFSSVPPSIRRKT